MTVKEDAAETIGPGETGKAQELRFSPAVLAAGHLEQGFLVGKGVVPSGGVDSGGEERQALVATASAEVTWLAAVAPVSIWANVDN